MEIREEFSLVERLCYCLAAAAKIASRNDEMIDAMLLVMFSADEFEEMIENSSKVNSFVKNYVGGGNEKA